MRSSQSRSRVEAGALRKLAMTSPSRSVAGSCERDFHSREAGTRGSAEPMGRRNLAAGTSPEQNEHYRYGELHFLCFGVGAFYV